MYSTSKLCIWRSISPHPNLQIWPKFLREFKLSRLKMILKSRMASLYSKSFRNMWSLGGDNHGKNLKFKLYLITAPKGSLFGFRREAMKDSCTVSRMLLDYSSSRRIRAGMEGLAQNCTRVWVHTEGDKQAGVENENKSNQLSESKFLTLPNILTLGRVAAVPLLIAVFYINSWWATTATASIFVAAAVTDWLDGYIARRTGSGSAFGAFLDPVADKLIVATTLVLLCTRPIEIAWIGQAPWLLPVPAIAIIGREITMSAVREWAAAKGGDLHEAVAVNKLGKWKTASQMIALTILLATRGSSQTVASGFVASGVAMLYVASGLGLWSLAVYMKGVSRFLLK